MAKPCRQKRQRRKKFDGSEYAKSAATPSKMTGVRQKQDLSESPARIYVDDRKDYRETRYIGVAHINQRRHVVVFTATETGLRVISLCKANEREVKTYEQR